MGRKEKCALECNNGADVVAQSEGGTALLDLASKWPCPHVHVDLAKLLIEHGAESANMVAQNKDRTPLHRVSKWGDV